MHVTRVELENIKSYGSGGARGEFSFSKGTTAIVGENGAGKTTILEAVAWALFDVLDYSKDDFLRRGAKKGSVRVTFVSDVDEREYLVYRDTGTGYYVYDPELRQKIASGKADVRPFINLHLGVEPGTDLKSLFRSAIGVPQGFFTTDFLRTAAERQAAFNRLLKVEEYRESADRLRDTTNLIRERAAEARGRVQMAEAQLARYEAATAERAASVARVEELSGELEELKREAEERERALAELSAAEALVAETLAAAQRLGVGADMAARRREDLLAQVESARRASERKTATEADFRAHVEATEGLRALETERGERDRLRAEASDLARMIATAESDLRRIDADIERAARARDALAALAADVARQEELERERERLRDMLAQARAAVERLARLDRELAVLRRQHAEMRERVRAAEGLAGAQARADKLESERLGTDNRLNEVNKSLTERKHLANQRREQAREVERLTRAVAQLEREARELEASAAEAARAPELDARERELTEQAARLRASIERDERLRGETRGGVCPILGDECTSFKEGRSFDSYFAEQLKSNRTRLASVEREGAQVLKAVRSAREAEKSQARFETTRTRLAQERALLTERESALARLDRQLAALPEATEELRDELQSELFAADAMWKAAREDALRYAELEPARERLAEIEREGKAKKEERDAVAAAASAAGRLEQDIRDAEEALRALGDPRGRSALLGAEAAREESLRAEARGARDALSTLDAQRVEGESKLAKFTDLDARWSALAARREETTSAHREYLESKSLADTLPARETEFAEAEREAAHARREAEEASASHERAASAYDRERHDRERGALAWARERAAAATAKLDAARAESVRLSAEIARLDEVRGAWHEELRSIERLEELHETTDFVRDVLRQAGPLVTESYLYNISIEANQFFREITGEGGRALRWTKDYEIMVEEEGYERSFVNLSGGEQMVAALSVRLALLKQLSDIRIAFFDEPTVNMDAERRERLAQQLGQVRHFEQLFVISHDDAFEQTVDHVVAVTRGVEQGARAEG